MTAKKDSEPLGYAAKILKSIDRERIGSLANKRKVTGKPIFTPDQVPEKASILTKILRYYMVKNNVTDAEWRVNYRCALINSDRPPLEISNAINNGLQGIHRPNVTWDSFGIGFSGANLDIVDVKIDLVNRTSGEIVSVSLSDANNYIRDQLAHKSNDPVGVQTIDLPDEEDHDSN